MASLRRVRNRTGGIVYEVRWREGGRQRRRVVGSVRALAEQAMADIARGERATRTTAATASVLAQDGRGLVDAFLAALRARGLREASLAYYGERLDGWLGAVGSTPPSRWSRQHFDAHLAAHPHWSPRSRQIVVRVLRRLYRWARKAGIYLPDPTEGVEVGPAPARRRVPLEPAQVAAVMEACSPTYAAAVGLAAYAGLSLGDVRTLTWGEVDLAGGLIARHDGRRKTGVALRVPILPELARALSRVRPLRAAPDAPVLPGLARGRSVYRTLQRAYGAAGVAFGKGDAWHLLRHSFGTLLMRAGVPAVVIGRLLSHQPGSVVTARYQHPDDGDLVAAMEAVGRHLARGAGS